MDRDRLTDSHRPSPAVEVSSAEGSDAATRPGGQETCPSDGGRPDGSGSSNASVMPAPPEEPEGHQIARSAGLVGLFTLASRILGLVRDAVVAAIYSRRSTDSFFVAYTVPNVLRRLLAEGSLTVAFIPVFTEVRAARGEKEARRMLASMLGAALAMLLVVVLVGMGLTPWIVHGFAHGLASEPDKFHLAVLLTRIMFPFLVTVGLVALAMGVLNTYRHFAAPALAPVLLNIFIIAAMLAGTDPARELGMPPISALAGGVVLGGVAQVLLQLPALGRRGMLPWPRPGFTDPHVLRVGKLMLPAVFGLAIYEVNVILARQFASFLDEGAISYLYYAARLIEFPMGIFAVAIATVAMPSFSSHAAAGDMGRLKETYRYALRMSFFIILPASAGLAALAVPLTSVLFQRGQFDHAMAVETAVTLVGFLGGLWASAGVRQTVPVFYALQDTRTPVKVAVVSLLAYAGAALLLRHRLQTLGLALAVSFSSTVNFLVLLMLLRRKLGLLGLRKVARSVVKSGLASLACAVVAYLVARPGAWSRGGAAPLNYLLLPVAVVAGISVYGVLCRLLRVPELADLLRAFRSNRGS